MPNLPNPVPRGTAGIDHDSSHDELHGDHNKFTAAGALVVGSGVGATATLAAPTTTGHMLACDTSLANKLEWASASDLGLATQAALDALSLATENIRTASYVLALSDANKVVTMNVATANTLTIPTNATVAFPIGTVLEVFNLGAGQATVTLASGVTVPTGITKFKLNQGSSASLRKRGTDEWVVAGDLVA